MIYTCKIQKAAIYINGGRKTIAEIKKETGCDVIFNAGYFNPDFTPCQDLKADGIVYSEDEFKHWVFGWNDTDVIMTNEYDKLKNYISCHALLVAGKPEPFYGMSEAKKVTPRPYTAWGIKADKTHVIYCSLESKTPEEVRQIMIAQGCRDALLLDGGGSSQMICPDGIVKSSRIVHNFVCLWIASEIIDPGYTWNGKLTKRSRTDHLILHHSGGDGSPEAVHRYHVSKGWVGIGYHYYIRKDGAAYHGRPVDTVGAHTVGYNDISIGVCFEGNFNVESMSDAQMSAGIAVITDILERYPNLKIGGHRDYDATTCPGSLFPLINAVRPERAVTVELDMLKAGSRGKQVRNVQLILGEMGYQVGPLDSDCGPKTDAAVRKYQADKGLTADGIVGVKTWEALLK